MLVLIDESGCPGFKLGKGSTPRFVVAMVRFDDYGQAERASAAIASARARLKVKPEFKFNKCRDAVRDGFFQAVMPFEFSVRAIVVDKSVIYSPHLRVETEAFYNYFVKQMLRHDGGTLRDAVIGLCREVAGGAAVPQSEGTNGVRTGRPQASSRDSHGALCRDRCVVGTEQRVRRRCHRADRP